MSSFDEVNFSIENFSGKARLFPLPNLVMFPHVMQPLHIFEPRYREMLEDSLADDRLIAMTTLKPGWEKDYEGRPPMFSYGCIGRVTTSHQLADGTYNVLLLGLSRIKLLGEVDSGRLFRTAKVQLCDDLYPPQETLLHSELQKKLHAAMLDKLPLLPEAQEQLDQLLESDVPLGMLTDLIAYMIDMDFEAKAELLSEMNVYRRAESILRRFAEMDREAKEAAKGKYPPRFSDN